MSKTIFSLKLHFFVTDSQNEIASANNEPEREASTRQQGRVYFFVKIGKFVF